MGKPIDYLRLPAGARALTRKLEELIHDRAAIKECLHLLDLALREAANDARLGEGVPPSILAAWESGLLGSRGQEEEPKEGTPG